MYLEGIILHCSAHIKQSRSIQAIYHLLKGKKGIQTVHDAHMFHLENFYGIHKRLEKRVFDEKVNKLIEQDLLQVISEEENLCALTEEGTKWLYQYNDKLRLHYFKGMQLHKVDEEFLSRLLLIIQTYTNIKMNHASFIPITDTVSVASWVKDFYRRMSSISPEKILSLLYSDLHTLFQAFPDREANFMIDHMTGYKAYGMSSSQLGHRYNLNNEDIIILRTAIVHNMMEMIEQEKNTLDILPLIIIHHQKGHLITHSAMETYHLLKSGLSLDDISSKRNLKLNTIYDHVVEISLFNKAFSIDDYVSESAQSEIIQAVSTLKSYKLKEIKEKVPDSISYFQIRLVLAKIKISEQ